MKHFLSLHAENVCFINQVLACIRLGAYSVFVWDVSDAGNLSLLASHIVRWSIFNFCCNCNDWKLIQYNGKNGFAIDNEASLFQFFSQAMLQDGRTLFFFLQVIAGCGLESIHVHSLFMIPSLLLTLLQYPLPCVFLWPTLIFFRNLEICPIDFSNKHHKNLPSGRGLNPQPSIN